MITDRDQLVDIFRDTIKYCKSPESHNDIIPNPIIYNNKYLDENQKVKNMNVIKPLFSKTNVMVQDTDSFKLAQQLLQNNLTTPSKILVLNMANYAYNGGGVDRGARAQEECIYRASNYFLHLSQRLYPMKKDEMILSRNVKVFKDVMNDYNYIEPFYVNCIACAALYNPKTILNLYNIPEYINENDRKLMEQKIYNLFRIAYLQGYDTLVLGALGCGAFDNPVNEVSNIFKNMIQVFNGCFKTVSFAVLGHGSKGNLNYRTFKEKVELPFKQ